MKIKTIVLAMTLLMPTLAMAKTKVIAHRGYWDTAGSAQNSLSSFKNAAGIKCFGSEIDIWITKDDVVVLNHNTDYHGMIVEETNYEDLKKIKLENGETVPTFEQFLQVAKNDKNKTKLIIEIKPHKDLTRQEACIKAALALVKKYKLGKRAEYITFSYPGVLKLIELAPKGTKVYDLNGKNDPKKLKEIGAAGPDYNENVFRKHPDWIPECKKLGLKVNVWTVDNTENMKYFIEQGVDFITTNDPVQLQKILKK